MIGWTDETMIEGGSATIRQGAFGGLTGRIVAYASGTVMIELPGRMPLPFGLGEIAEISETKGDALALSKGGMKAFLRFLSDWAEANGTAGRTIYSEPDMGPGTMIWRAR